VLLVIDTNVLLSGLLWRGPPHALLVKARDGFENIPIVGAAEALARLGG